MRARYPLKLLAPRAHQAKSALIYALSYGGGLVSGDCPSMKVRVKPGAALTILTQGSTKVSSNHIDSKQGQSLSATTFQRVDARVAENAVLLQLPDPVTCFAGADFVQRQRYLLADSSSSVVIADWFTSGRHDAHGESWQFHKYDSSIELYRHGRLVLSDRTLLQMDDDDNGDDDEDDAPTSTATRLPGYAKTLEPYRCHATVIVYGGRVRTVVERVRAEYSKVSIAPTKASHTTSTVQEHVWAMSDTRDKAGIVLRAASTTTECMRLWLRELLCDLEPICGDLVYERIFTT
ncbi:UreD-domain-containing protein [Syncephalis pseudoplumigaleata]|uniref:UreD-domain-containing protein n=1 Tax=Syncephalis pseudoplumigaleata TaxID=1712513 RepID=A0A4P9YVM9_9FUNG|nr:UreD-domain-containing protein [Syncephalis pseudoplumigaleata]|eukprot:RKP24096.1 UreD-domain-containing protein [Syncephalis pseudoplumigaleata]